MSIRRTIIIPAILALSTAGSILAGSALSAAAVQVPAAATSTVHPSIFYES
ncbi:MAG: hypothetical protein ACRDOL_24000 [Streptosporangiaceae bacterium]